MKKIKVEERVLRGIEYVNKYGGLDSMVDVKQVVRLCRAWGYEKTADWILANQEDYLQGLGHGFQAIPDERPEGLANLGDYFPKELKQRR